MRNGKEWLFEGRIELKRDIELREALQGIK